MEDIIGVCVRCLKRHAGQCAALGLAAAVAFGPVAEAMKTGVMKIVEVPTVTLFATSVSSSSEHHGLVLRTADPVLDGVEREAATPKLWNMVEETPGQQVPAPKGYKGTIKV